MMKKFLLVLLITLMVSQVVVADDEELFMTTIGDEQLYVTPFGDWELQMFFFTEDVFVPGAAGEYPYGVSTAYYDVIVNVLGMFYGQGDVVEAEITLINKGDVPDRDAILVYYLLSSENKKYGGAREVFEEVPPFSYNESQCRRAGGRIEPITLNCITVLSRSIMLPLNKEQGQWKFMVEYETQVQPKIVVYDTFYVGVQYLLIVLLAIIVFLVVLLILILYMKGKKGGSVRIPGINSG